MTFWFGWRCWCCDWRGRCWLLFLVMILPSTLAYFNRLIFYSLLSIMRLNSLRHLLNIGLSGRWGWRCENWLHWDGVGTSKLLNNRLRRRWEWNLSDHLGWDGHWCRGCLDVISNWADLWLGNGYILNKPSLHWRLNTIDLWWSYGLKIGGSNSCRSSNIILGSRPSQINIPCLHKLRRLNK